MFWLSFVSSYNLTNQNYSSKMETEQQQQPAQSPEPEETKFVDPPKKAQLDFAFKFIKQSIFTALEETENALNSLSWLDQSDNIPSNISEQDIMIMEETAQVCFFTEINFSFEFFWHWSLFETMAYVWLLIKYVLNNKIILMWEFKFINCLT